MTLPERADYSLTESALSPFPAEPAQEPVPKNNGIVRKTTQREKLICHPQVTALLRTKTLVSNGRFRAAIVR
jgi:hypothetical protein